MASNRPTCPFCCPAVTFLDIPKRVPTPWYLTRVTRGRCGCRGSYGRGIPNVCWPAPRTSLTNLTARDMSYYLPRSRCSAEYSGQRHGRFSTQYFSTGFFREHPSKLRTMFTIKAGYTDDIEVRSSLEKVREFFSDF